MVQGQLYLIQGQVRRPGNDVSLGKGDLAQAQEAGDDVVRQTGIAGFQAGHDVVFEAAVFLRMGVEDFPAGYGMHGRKGPQDETVPSLDIDFILLQAQLQKPSVPGAICSAPKGTMRAMTSRVPTRRRMRCHRKGAARQPGRSL